jgi:hypothetical protein
MVLKLKSGFSIRKIDDTWIAIPVGDRTNDVAGPITLNETAHYIWNILAGGTTVDDLLQKVTDEYDIDKDTALNSINAFIGSLRAKDLLEEC